MKKLFKIFLKIILALFSLTISFFLLVIVTHPAFLDEPSMAEKDLTMPADDSKEMQELYSWSEQFFSDLEESVDPFVPEVGGPGVGYYSRVLFFFVSDPFIYKCIGIIIKYNKGFSIMVLLIFLALIFLSKIIFTISCNIYRNIKTANSNRPLKKYFRNAGIIYLLYVSLMLVDPYHLFSNENTSSSNPCDKYSSKSAVESRISSLGYSQLSIQSTDQEDCKYQWVVQILKDTGEYGFCSMTTDGSSGSVQIVDVTCASK